MEQRDPLLLNLLINDDYYENAGEEMTKETKQKIFLAATLGLGLIYAYANYLFSPKWASIQTQKVQLQKSMASHQMLLNYQANQEELAKTIASLEREAQDLSARIPSQLDKPQIMVDIYTIAKLHEVDPQTLKFEPIQTIDDRQELTMSLTYTGQPENILNFIDDLEHTSLHKIALKSINLSRAKSDNSANQKPTSIVVEPNNKTILDLGVIDNISPLVILGKPQLNADIKFVAYSSSIGKADGTNKKPAFMFSNFGAESIAKMFEPSGHEKE